MRFVSGTIWNRLIARMAPYLTRIMALALMFIGTLVILEWALILLGIYHFESLFIPMAPSTAICFVLLSGALLNRERYAYNNISRYMNFGFMWIVFVFAMIVLGQFALLTVTPLSLDIETFFVPIRRLIQGYVIGRMSPLTAFLFILITSAMLNFSPPFGSRPLRLYAVQLTAIFVLLAAVIILIGYWYGAPLLYGGTITPVAQLTALCFILLSGVLLFENSYGWLYRWLWSCSVFSHFTRLVLPGTIGIILLQNWVHLYVIDQVTPTFKVFFSSISTVISAGLIAILIIVAARRVQSAVLRTENARRDSEERLKFAQQVAHVGHWTWDTETNQVTWSDEMHRIFGLDPATFDGDLTKVVAGAIHPEDQEKVNASNKAVLTKQKPVPLEYRVIWPDQSVHTVWAEAGEKIMAADGMILKLSGIVQDITERKRAEIEREHLLTELAAKNKELESIVYVASHDLRSPLINVQGFGQNLQKYTGQIVDALSRAETVEDLRATLQPLLVLRIPRALQFIDAGTKKMDILIDGLLQLSRVGRVSLQMESIDMNQLIQSILNTFAFQLNKIAAHIQVEKSLAACYGDKNQLNQVFSNLFDNALKYRDPERPLTITLSSKIEAPSASLGPNSDRANVVYTVSDTGLGIARENQAKIWELFRRLDNDAVIAGEGMGLTITRRIIERHHGRIWVESELGVGSRFYIELPTQGSEQ